MTTEQEAASRAFEELLGRVDRPRDISWKFIWDARGEHDAEVMKVKDDSITKLRSLIQQLHQHYNPGADEFDTDAALTSTGLGKE